MNVHQIKDFVCLLKALWWESKKCMIICSGSSSYSFARDPISMTPKVKSEEFRCNHDACYWIVWQILWVCASQDNDFVVVVISLLSCYSSFNLCISRSTGDVHTEIICWMGFCILHFMRSKRLNSKRRASEPIQLNKNIYVRCLKGIFPFDR